MDLRVASALCHYRLGNDVELVAAVRDGVRRPVVHVHIAVDVLLNAVFVDSGDLLNGEAVRGWGGLEVDRRTHQIVKSQCVATHSHRVVEDHSVVVDDGLLHVSVNGEWHVGLFQGTLQELS